MPSTRVDLLLHARWVIPIEHASDEHEQVLDQHTVAVNDGRIVAVLPTAQAHSQFQAITEHDLNDHALMPGLVNAHTHAAMALMRGIADDLPLMTWLNEHIWPTEAR